MKQFFRGLGLVITLPVGLAIAQSGPHGGHSPPRTNAGKPVVLPNVARDISLQNRSTLGTYRPFNPDEPLVDWYAANEQVRQAGGHIGLMKAEKASEPPTGSRPDPKHGEGHK